MTKPAATPAEILHATFIAQATAEQLAGEDVATRPDELALALRTIVAKLRPPAPDAPPAWTAALAKVGADGTWLDVALLAATAAIAARQKAPADLRRWTFLNEDDKKLVAAAFTVVHNTLTRVKSAADCKRDPTAAGVYGWLSDVDETATSLVAAIRTLRKGHSVAPGLAKLAQIGDARWVQLDALEPKLHDIAVNKEVSAGDRADIQKEIQLTSLVADDLLRDLRVKVWAAVDEGGLAADPAEMLRLFPRRSERRRVVVAAVAAVAEAGQEK